MPSTSNPAADARLLRDLLDEGRERGLEPEVVERRRPQPAGEVEQLPHRPRDQAADLAELLDDLGIAALAAHGLEPEQQGGQGLVDLVVEVAGDPLALALLGAQGRVRGAAALGLEPFEHRVERALDADDLLGPVRDDRRRRRLAEVGLLHLRDEILERREAAREQPDVDRDGGREREPENEADRGAVAEAAVGVRGDPRGDHGRGDQQQVHGQHLGEKGSATHHPPIGRSPPAP